MACYLFGTGGKLLLMGIVEPGVRTTVDAQSTAETLVLLASEAALYGTAIEVAARGPARPRNPSTRCGWRGSKRRSSATASTAATRR